MTRNDEFEPLRGLLFSIAYRILGSVSDAEDAVQETWLRYQTVEQAPDSPRAYLSTVITRVSIDLLRAVQRRRETYVGPWFPEPLLDDPYQEPERSAELADSVSMAALLLLERLSPLERAVFVLRDVFGFDFPDVARAAGRSEAACRQLAVRARRHMDEGRPRFNADRLEQHRLAARLLDAFTQGNVDRVEELLAADVQLVGDSGGKGPQWGSGVFGAGNVARLLASLVPAFLATGGSIQAHDVNGQPGALFRDSHGAIINTWSIDVLDGQIQTIRSVVNPDKLTHLGPVGDAWKVVHDTTRVRRTPSAENQALHRQA